MQSIVPNVISGMLLAALAGVAAGGMILWCYRKRRATSRFLDLISYLIAGIGLAASVFAISNYEQRIRDASKVVALGAAALTAVEQIRSSVEESCPRVNNFPDDQPRYLECAQLHVYADALINLDFTRGTLLPAISTEPLAKSNEAGMAQTKIMGIVFYYNLKARRVIDKLQEHVFSRSTTDQIFKIIYAAYAVSFAFGMGLIRRANDAFRA